MWKIVAACVFAASSALLSYRAVAIKAPAIEADIATRTAQVISSRDEKVEVRVDGRFVTLRGMAANALAKAELIAAADDVWGGLGPIDALWIAEPRAAEYYFSAQKQFDGSVSIAGIMPSNAARDQISAGAVKFFSGAVSNKIIAANPDGSETFVVPDDALAALAALDAGSILVAPDGITLAGSTSSSQAAAASQGLASRQGAAWRVFVNGPAQAAAGGTAAEAALNIAKTPDGTIEARGAVASAEAKASLLSALSGGTGTVIDLLTVQAAGLPADWDQRAQQGAAAMAKLDWAVLAMDAKGASLRGSGQAAQLQPVRDGLADVWSASLLPRAEFQPAAADASAPDDQVGTIAAAKDCKRAIDGLLAGESVNFETGSADLAQSSLALVGQLADAAKPCIATERLALVISGHTDDVGRPKDNLALSRQRADAVRAAFVKQGLAEAAMSAKGFGESRPVASNGTEEGRSANRRISFEWISR